MPWDVDRMKPSQIAAVLQLDRVDAIRAVPFEDAPFVARAPATAAQRTVRRVV